VSFVNAIKSAHETPTTQVSGASVFFYDQDGEPVACSFLNAPASKEEIGECKL
jgi:hypothetical protein